MLKFFRKIRKKLIEQDNVRKYLLYAIGEILLVVIGILIALQLNNWNQQRIELNKEEILLNNLKSELVENLTILERDIRRMNSLVMGLETLLQIMHDGPGAMNSERIDTLLASTFYTPNWNPTSYILEEFKNSGGFSRLNDPELKNTLFEWESDLIVMARAQNAYRTYAAAYIEYLTDYGSVRNLDVIEGSIAYLLYAQIVSEPGSTVFSSRLNQK